MARRHEMMYEENMESLQIPADAHTFEGFLRWLGSDDFPESGRIDFLAGEIEAEMSPEDLQTHGVLKVEIGGHWTRDAGRWTRGAGHSTR